MSDAVAIVAIVAMVMMIMAMMMMAMKLLAPPSHAVAPLAQVMEPPPVMEPRPVVALLPAVALRPVAPGAKRSVGVIGSSPGSDSRSETVSPSENGVSSKLYPIGTLGMVGASWNLPSVSGGPAFEEVFAAYFIVFAENHKKMSIVNHRKYNIDDSYIK